MPNYKKYSNDSIVEAVKSSISVMEVMRKLGIKYLSGSMHNQITYRIKKLKLDTSHFLGSRSNSGPSHVGGNQKKNPSEIFILNKNGIRTKSIMLRRAMIEDGFEYKCEQCGLKEWNNQKIVLEVDHKNGNGLDNRRENLHFLCPNCHSQKSDTHKIKPK